MSALQTYSKMSTESFIFRYSYRRRYFGRAKVGQLDSLDLPCAVKEGKEKLYFYLDFEARVLQELQDFDFFSFVCPVCINRIVLKLKCSSSAYNNVSTISKISCLVWSLISCQLATAVKYMYRKNFCTMILKQTMFCQS